MDDLEGDYVEGCSDGYINAYDTYLPPSNDNPFSDCTLDGTDLEQFLTFPAVDNGLTFYRNKTLLTLQWANRKENNGIWLKMKSITLRRDGMNCLILNKMRRVLVMEFQAMI